MNRSEIELEITRQLEVEVVANPAMPPGYIALVQDGKIGAVACVDEPESIYARALAQYDRE